MEKIRYKLAQISLDDPEKIEEVISEISFTLSEKTTTISQLQNIIDEMKERENNQEMVRPAVLKLNILIRNGFVMLKILYI